MLYIDEYRLYIAVALCAYYIVCIITAGRCFDPSKYTRA